MSIHGHATSSPQGVNPLRPYYIPPTIGDQAAQTSNIPGPTAFSRPSPTPSPSHSHASPPGQYASKARDIFSDLDYKDYISDPSPSVVRSVKDVVDELIWKYSSVFLAQPFEAAKLLLQVRAQDDLGGLAAAPAAANPAPLASEASFKSPWNEDVRATCLLFPNRTRKLDLFRHQCGSLTRLYRSPIPTPKVTSLPTSPLTPRIPRRQYVQGGEDL